jgi:hypothetical protein
MNRLARTGSRGPACARSGSGERRVVLEDLALERPRLGPRVEPELAQLRRQRPHGVQRLDLAPGPVQREREQPRGLVPPRLLGDEAAQFGERRVVTAEFDQRPHPPRRRLRAQLLEAVDLRPGERNVGQLGQRRAAPQRERLVARRERGRGRGGRRPPQLRGEALCIDALGVDGEPIAAGFVAQDGRAGAARPAGFEEAAEVGQPHGEGPGRRRAGHVAPDRLQHVVDRHDATRLEEQAGEHRALLRPGERSLALVIDDLQRSQDTELHVPSETTARA